MSHKPIITREIPPVPARDADVHKGDVGRLVIVGGAGGETMMVGAPALTANAAFRSGIGLVQVLVPEPLRLAVLTLAPTATARTLPADVHGLLQCTAEFRADVVALGPGLGHSLDGPAVAEFIARFPGPVVVDADGLNRLAEAPGRPTFDPDRVVLTPHLGELNRLLEARQITTPRGTNAANRREGALAAVEAYGCTVVLKGRGTVVTNGTRLYVNETGNAGMATGGAGDVLTGVMAGLIGQEMSVMEAAILGVYLHGLAGDFAAEELGRCSMTALDIVEYLPEAFCEYEQAEGH